MKNLCRGVCFTSILLLFYSCEGNIFEYTDASYLKYRGKVKSVRTDVYSTLYSKDKGILYAYSTIEKFDSLQNIVEERYCSKEESSGYIITNEYVGKRRVSAHELKKDTTHIKYVYHQSGALDSILTSDSTSMHFSYSKGKIVSKEQHGVNILGELISKDIDIKYDSDGRIASEEHYLNGRLTNTVEYVYLNDKDHYEITSYSNLDVLDTLFRTESRRDVNNNWTTSIMIHSAEDTTVFKRIIEYYN